MPKPVRGGQRYMPGLDGLRALAVLAVVAYHLGWGWAPGGLLGVGVFFTLSGYLITDLLLGQWEVAGRLQLADFWLRRARRLLPALFVMLAVVAAWVTLLDRDQLVDIRGAVAASAAYVNNWWLIAQHSSYFAQFGPPSPLGHLWSLAVEEQFYLVWPWLLWLGLRWQRRRDTVPRGLLAATVLLAVGSAVARADRRGAGVRLAQPPPGQRRDRHRAGDPRRHRGRRAGRDRRSHLAHQPVFPVLVPRRDGRAIGRHGAGRGRRRLARDQDRPPARRPAAAVDRRPVLRHLPVAFPDHRADHPGRRPGQPGPRDGPARRGHRRRRAVLAVCRGACPPRCHRPVVGSGACHRLASAGC